VSDIEYPYYSPYYPLPRPNPNYYSGGSNSTPSSTPTRSIVRLRNSEANIDPSTDENDVEEVVGGIVISVKKLKVAED